MGTHYRGARDDIRALNAYITLIRAAESVSGRIHGHLAQANLTIGQFGVLEALLHLGPLRQCDLCEKLLRSSGNLTVVVDNLERQGLVRRRRAGDDRRCVTVHLTGKGRQLIRKVFPRQVRALSEEFRVLTAAEQETLHRLCRTLGRQESTGRDER